LKVARTIAELDREKVIAVRHTAEAIQHRARTVVTGRDRGRDFSVEIILFLEYLYSQAPKKSIDLRGRTVYFP
jgi:hypothetical protein